MGYRAQRYAAKDAAYTSGTDVISGGLVPRHSGQFRIQIAVSAAAQLTMTGASATALALNDGIDLDPDIVKWSTIEVVTTDTINFSLNANLTIRQIIVTEIAPE